MARYKIDRIDSDFLRRHADEISDKDLEYICIHADTVILKAEESSRFETMQEDIATAFSLLKDYYHGTYRQIPWRAISAIAFSLIYFLNPLDLIPESLPLIGLLDDAAVLGLCFKLLGIELEIYRMWKQSLEEFQLEWDHEPETPQNDSFRLPDLPVYKDMPPADSKSVPPYAKSSAFGESAAAM